MKTLKDFDVRNKRVLVRCDFNVPLSEKGEILDDFRIRQTLPTIEYLIKKGAKLLLMSHLGRPDGKAIEAFSLKPVQKRLEELLGQKITLLENLRFDPREEQNDESFARELAQKGDIYINDAFGVCHRAHASVVSIPKFLPSGAGLLLEKEVECLIRLSNNPEKPLVAIMGGAKVETKVKFIDKISKIADAVLIGGLLQKELKAKNIKLKYPQKIIEPLDEVSGGKDIGPETIDLFKKRISQARTIFFNGALGLIEQKEFSHGTEEILKAIVQSKAFTVVGGGDMTQVISRLGLSDKFSHVSTGGGAMLAFLSGEKLPGLEVLK